MRQFHPGQASFLLSLTIHSISAQLELGTQLTYPTEFEITPILASTDELISQEKDYASNTNNNKECHSSDLQRRMRSRAYNQESSPPSAICPYEPGAAAAPLQYNLQEPPEAEDQLQFDGTKNDPNNPDPTPRPDSEKQKWWERLLTPLQDLVRSSGREELNDNQRAPYAASAICPDPKKQVAVCSAETPYLPGPGELVIEYCRFLTPFVSDCVQGEKAWCCKEVFVTDIKPAENGNDKLTSKRAAYKLTGEYCLLIPMSL